jgi:hypothetical protein
LTKEILKKIIKKKTKGKGKGKKISCVRKKKTL